MRSEPRRSLAREAVRLARADDEPTEGSEPSILLDRQEPRVRESVSAWTARGVRRSTPRSGLRLRSHAFPTPA